MKKINKRLLSMIVTIITLCSLSVSYAFANQLKKTDKVIYTVCTTEENINKSLMSDTRANANVLDLSDYIKSVKIQGKKNELDTNWQDTDTFKKGDYIKVDMNYELPVNTLKDTNIIKYKMPIPIDLAKDEQGNIMDEKRKQVAGTYVVDTKGNVTMTFNDAYVNRNEVSKIVGNISVQGKIDESIFNTGTTQKEITFGEATVTLKFDTDTSEDDKKADLSINKSAGQYDSKTKSIKYTITVTSNNGTKGKKVDFEDSLSSTDNIFYYDESTIMVKDKDGKQVEVEKLSLTNDKMSMTLPPLEAGGKYTITYDVKTDKSIDKVNTVKNTVSAKPGDDGEKKSGSTTTNIYINELKKEYTSNTDIKNNKGEVVAGKLNWTSTVTLSSPGIKTNDYYEDIIGYPYDRHWTYKNILDLTIKGKLGDKGTEKIYKEGTDYKVIYYGKNGKEITNPTSTDGIDKFRVTFLRDIPETEISNMYINYNTYADVTNLESAYALWLQNTGELSSGNKSVYSYTLKLKRLLVKKLDAVGNKPEDTSHNYSDINGILQWAIIGNNDKSGKEDIIIEDTLPEGTEYIEDSVKFQHYNAYGNKFTDTERAKCIFQYDKETRKMKITVPKAVYSPNQICISYSARITDKTKTEFKNIVKLTDGDYTESDSQTQKVIYRKVKKAVEMLDDNTAHYTADINPEGEDLSKEDMITVKDEFYYKDKDRTVYANLIPGSIHVYNRNKDGSKGSELEKDEYQYTYKERNVNDNSYGRFRTITLTLPDEKPLILEYDYYIKTNAQDVNMDFENTLTISGVVGDEGTSKIVKNIKVSKSNASVDVQPGSWTLSFYKVDENNQGIFLNGAVFELYKWSSTGNYEPVSKADGKTMTYTSNNDGYFYVENLKPNNAYMLKEVTAPNGYIPKDYYFYIESSDTINYPFTMPSDFKEKYPGKENNSTVYITNKKYTVKIEVCKVWKDINGRTMEPDINEIDFQLMRKVTEADGSSNNAKDESVGGIVKLTKEGNWKYMWDNLPKYNSENLEYKYYVKEISNISGFTSSYENNDGITSGTISIVNTQKSQAILPGTGSYITSFMFTITGTMLMVASIFVSVIVNKKKQNI